MKKGMNGLRTQILLKGFDRYRTSRPGILRFYLSSACSFNDLFIELFNSLVNRALPQNMTSDIANASARVVITHSILKATREEQNSKTTHYLIIKWARGNKDRRKQMQLNYLKS